jgi:acyl-CoA synthetase (NDP forming)/GNAT superfamily N-acetyltransferase
VAQSLDPAGPALSLGARVRGTLVGVVELFPISADTAEVAALVDRPWRDHGVATVLLEELAVAAGRLGIRRLVAEVLAENGAMLRVLQDLGAPVSSTRDGDAMHLEIALRTDDHYAAAAEGRHRRAAAASLQPVLVPETVAVVGAGRRANSIGRAVLRRIHASGFRGAVLAVNPHADRVDGVPCWPTVRALPCTIDLAVICVPAAAVAEVLEDSGRHGVQAAVIVSGGLAAVPDLPDRILGIADRYGMRLVGPNCVGVFGAGAGLDATFAPQAAPAGTIGLVAQSGGIVLASIESWARLGLGFSGLVSTGDAYDIGTRDALAWFDEDPATELVVLYAESEPDLRGLARTASRLSSRVPVLALESGTSAAGRRAAASHTARSATPQAVREAAYAAGGVQSVPDFTTLSAAVGLFNGQPLPRGRRVVVLTNVGGGGVVTADACTAEGLSVQSLPEELQAALRSVLPPLASTGNPVDTGAAASDVQFAAALSLLLGSPAVDAVVTVTVRTAVSDPAAGVASAVAADAAADGGVPVIDVRIGAADAVRRIDLPGEPGQRFLVSAGDPQTAARALRVAVSRREGATRRRAQLAAPADVDVRGAAGMIAGVLDRAPGGDWLRPEEVDALAKTAGLPLAPSYPVRTSREVTAAVRRCAGPVAVKGFVDGVLHKGDAGLLRLPVTSPAEARQVVAEWAARAGTRWLGAVVQPVVPPGEEFLVGGVRDPAAGAVVALGPGGRSADALGHRVHRLVPLTDADLEELLEGTGLFATGHGATIDRSVIEDCVSRVAWLVDVLPELAEFEVNPFVVTAATGTAVDVRARVAPMPWTGG